MPLAISFWSDTYDTQLCPQDARYRRSQWAHPEAGEFPQISVLKHTPSQPTRRRTLKPCRGAALGLIVNPCIAYRGREVANGRQLQGACRDNQLIERLSLRPLLRMSGRKDPHSGAQQDHAANAATCLNLQPEPQVHPVHSTNGSGASPPIRWCRSHRAP